MALDARRRQRKAEKRKAKERAKRKELARRKTEDMGQRLARTAAAPVLHCCTTQSLWDQGIAPVLISRELANGQVAYALFLIDRYCLGVKDGFCGFSSKSEYYERIFDRFSRQGEIVTLKPAAARKLVEGAVEYARGLGLSPHPDYAKARHIFGDIDPAASDREFEFGDNGKPHYITGPSDTPGRIASITGILTERLGPDGFQCTLIMREPGPFGRRMYDEPYVEYDDETDDEYDDEGPDDFADGDEDDVIEGSVAPKGSTDLGGAIIHLSSMFEPRQPR
jgi:hypothetical protein